MFQNFKTQNGEYTVFNPNAVLGIDWGNILSANLKIPFIPPSSKKYPNPILQMRKPDLKRRQKEKSEKDSNWMENYG